MSTPLIVLAVILAICAFILIPAMMVKSGPQKSNDQHVQGKPSKNQKKKKKR
ncbi:hypothetical protein OR1_02683 [Geobacter sp. OR-1]|uniref:hypothetical protein n=1 Tax=Geobacter sp. OR-1 TaxID=1266765 RepID=UPI000543FCB1|nr:hypothetical protein [Geobacter sp. OR-1]GAM10394.1 hypothetical protein OR1_02683 [Geobacter sp. OR-1]